jgi:calcium-dependent protein kinase
LFAFMGLCASEQRLPGNLDQNVEEVLKEVDRNNDGSIDYEEFSTMMRNMQSSNVRRALTGYRKGALL